MSEVQVTSTTRSSVATKSFGCVAVFALVFAGLGLLALFAAAKGILSGQTFQENLGPLIVGPLFTLVGIGIFAIFKKSATEANRRERLVEQSPDKPWMWREDWAAARIPDSGKAAAIGIWIFAGIWCAFTVPMAWLVISQNLESQGNKVWFVALFPAAGLILLGVAIRLTLQRMKYGRSYFVLSTLPGVIGRHLRGTIETSFTDIPPNGASVSLSCINRVTTGSGKNRSTTEHVRWTDTVELEGPSLQQGMNGINIPVSFEIPPDLPQCDDSNSNNTIVWRLTVSADVPGIDYGESFEVPVFETGATPLSEEERQAARDRRRAKARSYVPASPRVQISGLPTGGTEFAFHPQRKVGGFIQGLLWTIVSWAAVGALVYYGAVVFFPLFVGFIALLITAGFVIANFHGSTVTVQRPTVTIRHRVLGLGPTRILDASNVTDVVAEVVGQQKAASWEVKIKTADGKGYSGAAMIPTQQEAEWTAEKIRMAIKPL